ncbi:MAG: hypothetical protein LBS14_00050 [Holosporaceae bacterium]|jgi:hypothetical protein|nr:hypothetical protein [Holosporaceae bacterium]
MHALNDQRTLSIGQYAPVWLHGSPAQKELLLTDKNSAVPRNVLALLFNVPTPYGRDTFPRETTLEHLTQLVLRGADPKVTFQRDGRSYHGVSTLIRQASRATRAYRLGITCGRAIQLFGSYRAYFGRKEAATIRQLTALESFAKWLESRETE